MSDFPWNVPVDPKAKLSLKALNILTATWPPLPIPSPESIMAAAADWMERSRRARQDRFFAQRFLVPR